MNGTGGTIQNTTSDGVLLNQTIDPSLSFMNINDSADSGIFIDAVSGLNLTACSWTATAHKSEGGVIQDSGIHIEDLIGASNAITNSTIQDSRNTNLDWDPNSSSSMSTLTVTNTNLNHAGEGVRRRAMRASTSSLPGPRTSSWWSTAVRSSTTPRPAS